MGKTYIPYLKIAISVDHIVKEVANAIWKATMRKIMSLNDAKQALSILRRLIGTNIVLYSELQYLDKAFEISLSRGITIYDALYIVLALDRKLPLLTLDAKQREVARELGIGTLP